MEVLLRGNGGDGGATAVLVRCHGGHGGAAATPLRISPTRDDTAEVLNMLKVSAVPPQRSAVLIVFGGATAINDGITAEPGRSRRCHCGLCRTSTAVAPHLRCDGGSTAEARRNMLSVSAVLSRRCAVLTVFGGATAINDGTTAELRRSWRCNCGLCRTSTAVAPRIRCDGGITSPNHLLANSTYHGMNSSVSDTSTIHNDVSHTSTIYNSVSGEYDRFQLSNDVEVIITNMNKHT